MALTFVVFPNKAVKQRDKDLTLLNRWDTIIPGYAQFIPGKDKFIGFEQRNLTPGYNYSVIY